MTVHEITKSLQGMGNPHIAASLQRFFKTGKGQYGEGDLFVGIKVPTLRDEAKKFKDTPLRDLQMLIQSPYHEVRLCALLILAQKFSKAARADQKALYDFYLQNTKYINNWDLVDLSAPLIVGAFLADRDKSALYKLARSQSLWERRIAMISTFSFIKKNQFQDALAISEMLLDDREDLMHKAVGWMLREIGKRDIAALKVFLQTHYSRLPRTTLRYAIEKFPEPERLKYLRGNPSG